MMVLQHAEFLAVALIIIYAGAILVTYLFVIMLAQQGGSPGYDVRSREPFMAVLAGFVLMAAIAGQVDVMRHPPTTVDQAVAAPTAPQTANSLEIGEAVMTRYGVALQIAGILLLISMVGAIGLSRKRVPIEGFVPSRPPLGQIGREVEPY